MSHCSNLCGRVDQRSKKQEEVISMLTLVQVATLSRLEQFPHVVDHISLCLLDVYGAPLDEAVRKNWRTLLEHQLTSRRFGKHFASWQVVNAMAEAASRNRLSLLKMLFDYDPYIALSDFHVSQHPFTRAAAAGHLKMVQWICQHHEHHCTPRAAEMAAMHGHRAIVEYLLSVGLVNCTKCVKDKALVSRDFDLVTWLDTIECVPKQCMRSHVLDSVIAVNEACKREIGRDLVEKGGVPVFEWLLDRFGTVMFDVEYLIMAASAGDLALVQWFYMRLRGEKHLAVEAVDVACERGHLESVQFFASQGILPSSLDGAVRSGDLETVKFLVQNHGDVLQVREETIDLALYHEHVDVVSFLRPDFSDTYGFVPNRVYGAATSGNMDLIRSLFSSDVTQDNCFHALHGAIRGGHLDIVEFVYSEIKRRNWWGQGQLTFRYLMDEFLHASYSGDFRAIMFLLAQEHPGDTNFAHLIERAVDCLNYDLINLFYEKKTKGFNTLDMMAAAANTGSLRMVRFLVLNGLGCTTSNAIVDAATLGNLPIVEFLHSETRIRSSTEAMDRAARSGHLQIVKFLHFHRAEGCTSEAVCFASKAGHLEVVKFLLTHRNEGNAQEALEAACDFGRIEVVKWLVESFGLRVDMDLLRGCESKQGSCKNVLGMRATLSYLKSRLTGAAF